MIFIISLHSHLSRCHFQLPELLDHAALGQLSHWKGDGQILKLIELHSEQNTCFSNHTTPAGAQTTLKQLFQKK